MAREMLATLLVLTLAAPAAATPACYPGDAACCCLGCCPGWGWRSHGGLPPLPWAQRDNRSWAMNMSTVDYFVGMATGLDDRKELDAGRMLGYYGIGWELDNIPSNYTHLEAAEQATARALKALRPEMKVGVTRNTVVATSFWDTARTRMADPASNGFWLQCDGKPCTADQCDGATGGCANPAIADGGSCEDGDACTQQDLCSKGVCKEVSLHLLE